MKIIRGKKALVTGAASDIGHAMALALAREGADLFLLDIDGGNLAATAQAAKDVGASATGVSSSSPARPSLVVGRAALSGSCGLDRAGGLAVQGPRDDYAALIAAETARLPRKGVALIAIPNEPRRRGLLFDVQGENAPAPCDKLPKKSAGQGA